MNIYGTYKPLHLLIYTPCPIALVRCGPVASTVDNFAESASPV